jgi:hypothetical protein
MLSKQQLIHIATDAVLISLLFLYVNNKTKAVSDAMDDLREYTEDQIESINNKLDNIISHITKQQQVHQYSQPQKQSPKVPQRVQYTQPQQQVQPKSQKSNQSQVTFQQQTPKQPKPQHQPQPQQTSQVTIQQQVQPEIPKFRASAQVSKQVRFNAMPDITHIDEFVNSIPSSFAFISATTTPIMTQQQSAPVSNIEVIEEEEDVPEEDVSNDTINELDENDIEEINNALGDDSVETDDIKNE